MVFAILTVLLLLCAFIPQIWVRYVMHRYAKEIPELPGTGGELAEHLIDRLELADVRVKEGGPQDNYYNPAEKCVALSPKNYQGKSITAVAVAAHEVGHAIQFTREEPLSKLRAKYLPISTLLGKIGIAMLMALPIVGLILKAPIAIVAFLGISILFQLQEWRCI